MTEIEKTKHIRRAVNHIGLERVLVELVAICEQRQSTKKEEYGLLLIKNLKKTLSDYQGRYAKGASHE